MTKPLKVHLKHWEQNPYFNLKSAYPVSSSYFVRFWLSQDDTSHPGQTMCISEKFQVIQVVAYQQVSFFSSSGVFKQVKIFMYDRNLEIKMKLHIKLARNPLQCKILPFSNWSIKVQDWSKPQPFWILFFKNCNASSFLRNAGSFAVSRDILTLTGLLVHMEMQSGRNSFEHSGTNSHINFPTNLVQTEKLWGSN